MKSSKKRSRAVVTDASDVIEVGFDDTDEFREATLFGPFQSGQQQSPCLTKGCDL